MSKRKKKESNVSEKTTKKKKRIEHVIDSKSITSLKKRYLSDLKERKVELSTLKLLYEKSEVPFLDSGPNKCDKSWLNDILWYLFESEVHLPSEFENDIENLKKEHEEIIIGLQEKIRMLEDETEKEDTKAHQQKAHCSPRIHQ